ncbi:hypothetical protein C0J45_15001 [Silurus meridionalis]|nr:hypothetical protein C0J45_15001 [Silurus meridionalis]
MAAALGPVFAVLQVWAALWALLKQRAAWRRTTFPLHVRIEVEHVDLRGDAVLLQVSAVTQWMYEQQDETVLHVGRKNMCLDPKLEIKVKQWMTKRDMRALNRKKQ